MLLGMGIIVVGISLLLLGIHSFSQTNGNGGTFFDLLINGWTSGLGQIIVSIVFIMIGIIILI
ncbi:hypothetical protein [Clostridium butyricum]|uniref:hypothetical protein n=1 Tax=Clostridium butyricum TaxID=1492 RepID=UPI0021075A8E|nr:hypothetical protein [Clostridium butyricum]MCQ2027565.1 hypothetical protein [Clostridium butyricum]